MRNNEHIALEVGTLLINNCFMQHCVKQQLQVVLDFPSEKLLHSVNTKFTHTNPYNIHSPIQYIHT